MPTVTRPSITEIRAQFPALDKGTIYMENAGGSQVPLVVADSIRDFMLTKYVQVGATYDVSKQATDVIAQAREFLNVFVNGTGIGRVTFAASTSGACKMLADAYANIMEPGDEIIVAETGHEANIGPWAKLEGRGFNIRTWKVDRESLSCPISSLEPMLSRKTKIVAFPQTSNILGDIVDARRIVDLVHSAGAKVVLDGVAFAPHRCVDVAAFDADWYVYSAYKVFGPHMAVLFGKTEAFAEIKGPGHFFLAADAPGRFELGCPNYEGIAGILALWDYLQFLAGTRSDEFSRQVVQEAWRYMTELEMPLQKRLIEYLLSKPQVRLIGPAATDDSRVGIVSFVHESKTPPEIVAATDAAGIGIRSGHAYAYRLCEALGIDTATGVVRVSFAHYNTTEEVERLISVLDMIL